MKKFKLKKCNLLLLGLIILGSVCLIDHFIIQGSLREGLTSKKPKQTPEQQLHKFDTTLGKNQIKILDKKMKSYQGLNMDVSNEVLQKQYEYINLLLLANLTTNDSPQEIAKLSVSQLQQLSNTVKNVYGYYNNNKEPPSWSGTGSADSITKESTGSTFGLQKTSKDSSKKHSKSDSKSHKKSWF